MKSLENDIATMPEGSEEWRVGFIVAWQLRPPPTVFQRMVINGCDCKEDLLPHCQGCLLSLAPAHLGTYN
jgi:hypothetical protein